jgi:hypothetical protein
MNGLNTSRWGDADRQNAALPCQGGVFNYVNLHVYHYAGTNPVKYTDPDGRDIIYQDSDGNEMRREISDRNEVHTPESDKDLMDQNADIMKKNYLNLFFFNTQVKTEGAWDFKNKERSDYRSYFWFNGELISAEEFGNIHYGYVGNAGGIPTGLLIDAPGIAQIKRGTSDPSFWLTNFDDPLDTANILRGIRAYKSGFFNLIFRYTLDFTYNVSGARLGFRIYTLSYFIYKPSYSTK